MTKAIHRKTDPAPSASQIANGFRLALAEAALWRGSTSPNPPVGCTILDLDGQVLAVAAHHRAGEMHAEALALQRCKFDGTTDQIHTIIVTLEPCNHTGRTPPCSEAILASPCQAVWVGMPDPNPGVAGGGIKRLRDAGLVVQLIQDEPLRREAAALLAPFTKRVKTGLPWVTVKQAMNHQGSMIPPAGQTTFTSPSSLTLAHELRKRCDAVLTGSGTILADNPAFTVRRVTDFSNKRRLLLVADRRRRVPRSYSDDATARGFDVVFVSSLDEALTKAADAGALEILVEAGPSLTAAILATDHWDEHVRIEQNIGGDDQVIITYRMTQQGSDNVFRNH